MPEQQVFFSDYTLAEELDLEESILHPAGLTIIRTQAATEEEVVAALEGLDPVALVTQWAPITPRVLDLCPRLKVVSRNGIGVDNIDLEHCQQRGIVVTNSPRYCIREVADHALALLLALSRKLLFTTDQVRSGGWGSEFLVPIRRLSECTLGVIGMGSIGRAVVERARPFFGQVIGHDAHVTDVMVAGQTVPLYSLDDVLSCSDFVTLHVPGTPETTHLINAQTLARMKPGAYLVNTCRGIVVDTEALAEALSSGHLRGAGLDVFEQEPLPGDHPLRFFPEVIITPHVAYYSEESTADVRRDTCVNIVNVLSGQPPVNRVV